VDSTAYVAEALENLRLPMVDFAAGDNPNDDFFELNDWVEIATSVDTAGSDSDIVDELLEDYVNQTVYLPVFNQTSGGNVRVAHIAKVTINDVCLPHDGCLSANRQISISFETYNDSACN
jgi:hypothetical protein